jgi:glycosyltransferase involved in cell wall biosynthesis
MSHSLTVPVSAIVMSKDEERNIAQCLAALQAFSEIFVVDSHSTDNTRRIAAQLGAIIVDFEWSGGYPRKKEWALRNLPFANDWVMFVDADEVVTTPLVTEIYEVLQETPPHVGFFVRYDYVFLNRVLRHGHQIRKLILVRHSLTHFPDAPGAEETWEVEGHYQPLIDGPVGTLRHHMLHCDHDRLDHYFERHNRYSDWEAESRTTSLRPLRAESLTRGRRLAKSLFGRLPFRGAAAFLHSYVLRLGFLDGRAGFHYALARAFYYWQITVKVIELRERSAKHR